MKSLLHYITAPGRRIKHYSGMARQLGYSGISRLSVATNIIWWKWFHHTLPQEYIFYRFDRLPAKKRRDYLLNHDQYYTYQRLNGRDFLKGRTDKVGKEKQYVCLGSELVTRKWVNLRDDGLDATRKFVAENGKVLFKPNYGSCGAGIFVYDVAEGADALEEALFKATTERCAYLCEQYVVQHPTIAALHPSSVNTVRILTLNDHGNISIQAATLKIGISDCVVDNIRHEGLGANIDLETGVINTDARDLDDHIFSHHPETGVAIKGLQIPHWDRVCEAARSAAKICDCCVVLGIDIAVTEDGAEIIEVNNAPGTRIVQSYDREPKGAAIHAYYKANRKSLHPYIKVKK